MSCPSQLCPATSVHSSTFLCWWLVLTVLQHTGARKNAVESWFDRSQKEKREIQRGKKKQLWVMLDGLVRTKMINVTAIMRTVQRAKPAWEATITYAAPECTRSASSTRNSHPRSSVKKSVTSNSTTIRTRDRTELRKCQKKKTCTLRIMERCRIF